ncbi:MAG: TrmH family RNA methyltransferase [Verrucomicrobiota bacterium]
MKTPIIILFKTQLGENIGMCARAMLNCGLDQLRLVAPRDGWPNPAATATAADADRVLKQTQCFETLDEAISDCHRLYATTARPRSQSIPCLPVMQAVEEIFATTSSTDSTPAQQSAILFGPEASGLDNNALSRADALIHFPTNPEFSSLNLAQAVLLFAWEWRRGETSSHSLPPASSPATKKELSNFLDRLENELDQSGFFLTPELRPETLRKLRTIFTRSQPNEQELNMLHGIITALKKA